MERAGFPYLAFGLTFGGLNLFSLAVGPILDLAVDRLFLNHASVTADGTVLILFIPVLAAEMSAKIRNEN
jgi:hypothetical protein